MAGTLEAVFNKLYKTYGPQGWWPAKSRFEVIVGAVLTQNTAWSNVEKAITNLRRQKCLSLSSILAATEPGLAECLRPSGYFNIKTRRLKNLCEWIRQQGGVAALSKLATPDLRHGLLSVNGVGPETADDILLYAFERPVFVVDAYTRRIMVRMGLLDDELSYEQVRSLFEGSLKADVRIYNEYHALIVRHAKEACRKKPLCGCCCLRSSCKWPG